MAADLDSQPHGWLHGSAMRAASDACLGLLLLVAGMVAVWAAADLGLGVATPLAAGDYPRAIGWLLLAFGIAMLLRAVVLRKVEHARWSLTGVAVIAVAVLANQFAVQQWGLYFMLSFGPPEYVAIIALELALAIALARASRLRAIGMVLLGLLIATIGVDVSTGVERFTMGLDSLADGVMLTTVVLGFAVADGVLAVASPSLLLASYARKVGHKLVAGPRLPVDLLVRVGGALLIAAALYLAYWLEGSGWPTGQIAAFAMLGIACQMFDWNRLVLLIALRLGPLLEENIGRALVLAQGDFGIYWARPISATVLALAVAIVIVAMVLSAWVTLAGRRQATG